MRIIHNIIWINVYSCLQFMDIVYAICHHLLVFSLKVFIILHTQFKWLTICYLFCSSSPIFMFMLFYAFDYCYYFFQPGSTIIQFTLNTCLHAQLHTYYNVITNLEWSFHNNIHVCILNLEVNNTSWFRSHMQSVHIAFMISIFTIYSRQYTYILDYFKIVRNQCIHHEYDSYNKYYTNTHYYATTVIF